jgi:tellurite resistance protein TehA-like permease
VVWALAALLLVTLTAATGIHWARGPGAPRRHLTNPVMGHFYGAPPMALLTVGAGTILLGRDVVGPRAAIDIDWVLWFAGAVTGLAAAAVVPFVAVAVAVAGHHNAYRPRTSLTWWSFILPVLT